jgi:hypothetical protein
MKILAAIRREERELEKKVGKLQRQLTGLKTAAMALGNSASDGLGQARKKSHVGGSESEDVRSREKTVGEGKSRSEESCRLGAIVATATFMRRALLNGGNER